MPFKNQRSPSAPIVYGGVSINPQDGSISADSLDVENLTIGGDAFENILAGVQYDAPGGIVWRQKMYGTMPWVTTYSGSGYASIFQRYVTFEGGRLYHVTVSPIEIEMSGSMDSRGMFGFLIVQPRRSNSDYFYKTHYNYAEESGGRNALTLPGATYPISLPADSGLNQGIITFRIYSPTNGGTWRIRTRFNDPEIQVIDMGSYDKAAFSDTNLANVGIANPGAPAPAPEDPPLPPPPPPEKSTTSYTSDFYATQYATYSLNSGNNQTSDYPGIIRQGTASVPRIGMTRFSGTDKYGRSLADLRASNVVVKSAVVYIGAAYGGKTTKWYYSSGGIGRLYYHNASSFPSEGVPGRTYLGEIPNWKNAQERSYNGGSTIVNAMNNGTFKGFALSGEGRTGQNTYHGDFPYRMRLRVTYTVTE